MSAQSTDWRETTDHPPQTPQISKAFRLNSKITTVIDFGSKHDFDDMVQKSASKF
jgi:hypothetical protein